VDEFFESSRPGVHGCHALSGGASALAGFVKADLSGQF